MSDITLYPELVKCLDQLCDNSKLERDRGEEKLLQLNINSDECKIIINWIYKKFSDKKSLEKCLGCLTACKLLMNKFNNIPSSFLTDLSESCLNFLHHDEFRVRILAGECMGLLCKILGLNLFHSYIDVIKKGIKISLIENIDVSAENIEKYQNDSVFHNSSGLESLETWIKCLQFTIGGLGTRFEEFVDMEMFSVIFEAVDHKNRFVRDTTFDLLGTIADGRGCVRNKEIYLNVCRQLRKGLSDNWSQVRMAASVATRKILMGGRAPEVEDKEIYSLVLPGICFNRYYHAEGVRLYNQETWKLVVGDSGKQLLEQYIKETVAFYIEQSGADNHFVRETACTCMSEIAVKLSKDVIRPFFNQLLDTLIMCFNDYSWPVRDMACLASGKLVSVFPEETKIHRPDALIPLFFNSVLDNVVCGRESGAFSLANVIGAYDSRNTNYLQEVVNIILEHLGNIKDQKADSCPISGFEHHASVIIKGSVDSQNVKFIQGGREIRCCEPQTPETGKGRDNDNCHNDITSCQSEQWEKADGCILLIGELSKRSKDSHAYMDQLIPSMLKACSYHHYPNYVYLLGTACKTICDLCDGLGKQKFKHFLSDLLSIISDSFSCDCNWTVSEAENTVRILGSRLGSNILKGRIEMCSSDLFRKTGHLFPT